MHTYGLWVNSYFPTDPQTAMFDDNELREVLAAIKSVIEKANCDDILFDGDINSDFCRNTKYVLHTPILTPHIHITHEHT